MRPAAIALAVAAAVLLAGCAEAGLDRDATETAVRASLLTAHPGVDVAVDCADARCTAVVAGVELPIVLVERAGSVGYELLGTVVAADDVAATVADRLGDDLGTSPVVDCGPAPLLVPEAGGALRCTATDAQRRHAVALEWVGSDGEVAIVSITPDAG